MGQSVIKNSSYRQRIYQDANGEITLVFGNDNVPVTSEGFPKLLADHDVVQVTTVTPHVDDAPTL
jgi:hypothetical protein